MFDFNISYASISFQSLQLQYISDKITDTYVVRLLFKMKKISWQSFHSSLKSAPFKYEIHFSSSPSKCFVKIACHSSQTIQIQIKFTKEKKSKNIKNWRMSNYYCDTYADFETQIWKIKYFYPRRNFTLLWPDDYCISNTNIYFFASTYFPLGSLQKLLTLLRHRKLWTVCLSTKSFIAKGNWILSGRGKYGWKTGVAMVTYRVIAK